MQGNIVNIFFNIQYLKITYNGKEYEKEYTRTHGHVCSVTQSWPTLCNPMVCSPPGSSVHGISQAKILEWVAISFSRGSFWLRNQTQVSCIASGFFTDWATREAYTCVYTHICMCVCVCVCVCIKLNHFAAHLKLTQHLKSTILPNSSIDFFKNNNLKYNRLNSGE